MKQLTEQKRLRPVIERGLRDIPMIVLIGLANREKNSRSYLDLMRRDMKQYTGRRQPAPAIDDTVTMTMITPIFSVFVEINPEQITEIQGSVTMIPFTGTVRGEWFNGIVAPGGTDTQVVDESGARHMSARYVLKGTDCAGQTCQIYVANEGVFEDGNVSSPFCTVPTFISDSAVLAERFRKGKFRGEGHPEEKGPVIRFFEEKD